MGLFDFLKSKKDSAAPAAPASAPAPTEAGAAAPAGPRYKGASYTSPVAPEPAHIPAMPPLPPMPQLPPFEPVNILEQLLLHAATQPEARPDFYRALLGEELILVMVPKEGEPGGEKQPTEGMEIQLQVLNDGKIPVFSSVDRMYEGNMEVDSVPYLRIRGLEFFQMVQGAECALNPFSSVGKLLPAEELADLLAGRLFPEGDAAAGQNIPVLLGQPTDYPTQLLDALRTFSAEKPAIQAVYLAQVQLQDNSAPPRLLLAFHTDDNDAAFLQELGPVVQGNISDHELVDVLVLDPNSEEPLNQYFTTVEPVYKRS
ncbi:SseB protein N-terminal domain-containing protein [Hymenobacter daecheongensis DSM 21074]|uniref:SseB protein N-terminal domain-containing protein n=1 Tax=Hymenobacter daecheongensis DSM 21074 TaxID=1121955 RepID=A0A1M6HVP4_9BACT|nr:enhanced serine sensitivity protein SseB C-terminal domain-containing protein [Hymenobacter daecheongensis]SHJ26269.1 SseB protein N-terminal domain-containing protein [Hymenobacter daecheongensis DSM 21074]